MLSFSAAELQNGHWVTSRGRKTSDFLNNKSKSSSERASRVATKVLVYRIHFQNVVKVYSGVVVSVCNLYLFV